MRNRVVQFDGRRGLDGLSGPRPRLPDQIRLRGVVAASTSAARTRTPVRPVSYGSLYSAHEVDDEVGYIVLIDVDSHIHGRVRVTIERPLRYRTPSKRLRHARKPQHLDVDFLCKTWGFPRLYVWTNLRPKGQAAPELGD